MSIKHWLKLIPARLRWRIRFIREAIIYSESTKHYRYLKDLEKETHESFLVAERQGPTSQRTYELAGKLQAIREIKNGGWK